jgi:adenosine deaminase
MQPRTDLHTHFAGVLSADELLDLAGQHDLSVDVATAKRTGMVDDSYEGEALPVSSLSEEQLSALKSGLELDVERQSLFDDLEVIYQNRAFITKNPAMFAPLLEEIGRGYQRQGVEYTELSFAGIINNPEYIRIIHEKVPQIEEETGVKIRFLGALWRHSDYEWNMDEVDRLKSVLKSPYIVGIDVMGHEKNPIRDLEEPLQEIVKYAAENIPGFAIRIHAGENPYYSADPDTIDDWSYNNAHESVQIIDDARKDENGNPLGKHGDEIQIRMGHGRYGLHLQTLDLMGRAGCIAELCLESNNLLNHADHYQGPFNLYAEHGVSFVLGSDGYGIYGTTQPREYTTAKQAGMNNSAEELMDDTESTVIANDEQRLIEKAKIWAQHKVKAEFAGQDPFEALVNVSFDTVDGQPRFNPAVEEAKRTGIEKRHDDLLTGLAGIGVESDEEAVQELLGERTPVLFSGASKTSWARLSDEEKTLVESTLKSYIDQVDAASQVIVTGGTNYGFEEVVHRLVAEKNASVPPDQRISVIGAVTLEANLDEIAPDTLSHAMVLKYGGDYAMSWMDQSPALLDMVERQEGHVIFGGGGQVIRDMIVDANGRGLIHSGHVFLFDGPAGASTEKAGQFPQAAFRDADSLIAKTSRPATMPVPHMIEPEQPAHDGFP